MNQLQQNSIAKKHVYDYVMNFGRPLTPQLQKWVSDNFNFSPKYSTKSLFLNNNMIQRHYTRQQFIQRLKIAYDTQQAMNLIRFIEKQNEQNNLYEIKWIGDFTVNSYVTSPHWEVTSLFDEDFKFKQMIFIQKQKKDNQQSCAPPVSWKAVQDFKYK